MTGQAEQMCRVLNQEAIAGPVCRRGATAQKTDSQSPGAAAFLRLGLATGTRVGGHSWVAAADHILPDAGGGIPDHCRSDVPPRRDMRIELRAGDCHHPRNRLRSEEHTSELQSLMRISYAVFCLKKKTQSSRIAQQQ